MAYQAPRDNYRGFSSTRSATEGPPNRPDAYKSQGRVENRRDYGFSGNQGMPDSWGAFGVPYSGGGVNGRPPLSMPTSWARDAGPKVDYGGRQMLSNPDPRSSQAYGQYSVWGQGSPDAPMPNARPADFVSRDLPPAARQRAVEDVREMMQGLQRQPSPRPDDMEFGVGGPAGPAGDNVPNRRVRNVMADAGVHKGPRKRNAPRSAKGRVNGPRGGPRKDARRMARRPEYDGRYGHARRGVDYTPYPSMNESNYRQSEAHRVDRGGPNRAFAARVRSGLYTPAQAAAAVDRQYNMGPTVGNPFNNPRYDPRVSTGGYGRGPTAFGGNIGGYDRRGGMSGTYGTRGSTLSGDSRGQAGGFGGYSPSRFR